MTTTTKASAGAKRAYSAHAETNDHGSAVTFTNYGSAEETGALQRERERMFGDYDPAPSVSSWEGEREAVARHRESIGQLPTTATRHTVKTARGELVRERTAEELEPTFAFTVGLGNVAIDTVAAMVARDSAGYGFNVSHAIGYWRGERENCATITFQGPRPIATSILYSLAGILPAEEFAHVTESQPITRYVNLSTMRR